MYSSLPVYSKEIIWRYTSTTHSVWIMYVTCVLYCTSKINHFNWKRTLTGKSFFSFRVGTLNDLEVRLSTCRESSKFSRSPWTWIEPTPLPVEKQKWVDILVCKFNADPDITKTIELSNIQFFYFFYLYSANSLPDTLKKEGRQYSQYRRVRQVLLPESLQSKGHLTVLYCRTII